MYVGTYGSGTHKQELSGSFWEIQLLSEKLTMDKNGEYALGWRN